MQATKTYNLSDRYQVGTLTVMTGIETIEYTGKFMIHESLGRTMVLRWSKARQIGCHIANIENVIGFAPKTKEAK